MLYEFIEDNNGDLVEIKTYCSPCGERIGVEDNWPTTIKTDYNQSRRQAALQAAGLGREYFASACFSYCVTCGQFLAEGMKEGK
jgi:hypothetical protein